MNANIVLLIISQLFATSHAFHPSQPILHHAQTLTLSSTKLKARPQTISNTVQKNITTRRTINNFSSTLPPHWETALQKAIHAGIHAPNHKRTEPWRFYLLGKNAIEKICRLNADMVAESKGAEAAEMKYKRWKDIPGWLVVTCCTAGKDDMNHPTSLAREDYAACCCAVQNVCLSLHASGIGTKWTTGAVNFDDRFADAVGFDFGEECTVGTIWFGEAIGSLPVAPTKKFKVQDVLKKVA